MENGAMKTSSPVVALAPLQISEWYCQRLTNTKLRLIESAVTGMLAFLCSQGVDMDVRACRIL